MAQEKSTGTDTAVPPKSSLTAEKATPVEQAVASTSSIVAPDVWPSNYSLAGYTTLVSATTLATYPQAKITDFKVGLLYSTARRVGQVNTGGTGQETPTPNPPVWVDQFEMIQRVVTDWNINQDLMDFQQRMAKGEAYYPGGSASYAVAVTGVTVAPTTATLSLSGVNTQVITPTIAPAGATNKTVYWSSSNPLVATVNTSGTVTGVNIGSANIYATTADGTKVATTTVTVGA